ncbi:hypothetical protein E1A91_A13G183000v1 [Gossypium mustelinum]|uniref:Uncharacterized protein n=1 Tax=Gossypium mustelinum TaxID=34275 RepID=A0A5D2WJQ9_GOSMU|nr:hypothetical protein E1A91_A13G183000v1 [Gossypium mustelinum]
MLSLEVKPLAFERRVRKKKRSISLKTVASSTPESNPKGVLVLAPKRKIDGGRRNAFGLADVKVYGGCTRVVHGVYGGCLVATAAPSNKGNPKASVSKTF